MTSTATINLGSIKSNTKLNIKKVNTTSKSINLQMNSTASKYDEIDYSVEPVSTDLDNLNIENSSFKDDLLDGIETVLATGTIVVTSVASGVLKIYEYIFDGLTWVGGAIVSGIAKITGNDEFAAEVEDWTMNQIAKDRVAELNESFYANTELGKTINEKSAMKYDSDLAKGIQKGTTMVVEVAGATAATVATGGAAAPVLFAVGFAEGAGESAEEKFKDTENRDFWKDSLEIGIDGTIKGISTVAYGKAGSTAVNGVKSLASTGVKNTVKETLKAFNKDAIKTTIKTGGKKIVKSTAINTLKDKDTWLETGAVLLDEVKAGVQTGEWNITNMLCDVALIYGENYIGNLSGEILSDSVKKVDRITELYGQSQDMARGNYNVGFKSYREHAEKHVYYVASYMQDISKNVDGINVDEALFGSLVHDLGMKGGYVKYNDRYIKADTLLDMLKSEGKSVSFNDIADYVRKPHPLNSALTVLTDDVVPDGVDKDVVALLAMSHSKSTSGITYFDNKQQWNSCIDELESALKQYNKDNGTSFNLDTQKLKDMINDPEEYTRLQKEALIIRDGDAMSKVATLNGDTIMQTGNVSHIENKTPRTSFNDVVVDEKTELAGLSDNLKTIDGQDIINGDVSSGVKFHVGELNTKFSSQTDGISYYSAYVDLVEPNQTPNSTLFAINERIGEVNTYSNCATREFIVNLPTEAKGTALGKWYKTEIETKLRNKLAQKASEQLNVGIIDESTYKKQLEFYKNIKVNFE